MPEQLRLISNKLILSRLIICALGFASLGLGVFEHGSLNHTMLVTGGGFAKFIVIVAAVLNTIALFDTIINDMMPAEYTTVFDRRIRHLVWSAMASIWMMYTFVLMKTELSYWLASVYFIYSISCMSIAVLDTIYEKAERGWNETT